MVGHFDRVMMRRNRMRLPRQQQIDKYNRDKLSERTVLKLLVFIIVQLRGPRIGPFEKLGFPKLSI